MTYTKKVFLSCGNLINGRYPFGGNVVAWENRTKAIRDYREAMKDALS